jgi:hypothetical protein
MCDKKREEYLKDPKKAMDKAEKDMKALIARRHDERIKREEGQRKAAESARPKAAKKKGGKK